MPRDSKEQRNIKIEALKEAVLELKESSTASTNLLTYQNVVDLANENFNDKILRNISQTSIKKPTSKEFKEIKSCIENFRDEHKKIKDIVPEKSLKEVSNLKKTIEGLSFEIAKFYDEKLQLNQQLELKDKTIVKLREELKLYIRELEEIKHK